MILKIAHIHVWDKKNKGDVAIVLAVQELLKAKFAGVKIFNFPVEVLKNYDSAQIKKINNCDLVIFGGGGLFYHYFLPYNSDIIKAIKIPLFIFGVGYIKELGAPDLNKEKLIGLLALVNKASLVGARDFYTRDFLLKNKIAAKKIKVIGDPAVLLKEKKVSLKVERNLGLAAEETIKIGLNLNYSGWLGFGQWRADILSAYQSVANYFQNDFTLEKSGKKSKVQIYYLKHHPGENNIYKELKIPGLKVIDLKPAEQKYVYGQLDLVVGMMLHAGVLAFGALTPEINVAYDLRNYSFAKFIACPELVVNLEDLKKGELLKRVKSVFKKRGVYIRRFDKKRREIRKQQADFLQQIKIIYKPLD
ncbi:MAG: polysaccharide pyruvyl transferase family protein [Candidatus Falkowbacteria bacterium]|nr:polysaccharide pyruvyl transferase family protein [Candidatus Falkowbacteria bacterium]